MVQETTTVSSTSLKSIVAAGLVVAAASPAAAQDSAPPSEAQRRQTQIVYMERTLTQAVKNGAAELVRQIRLASKLARVEDVVMSGEPAVRGFQLQDYGVFFDVRVPAVRPVFALAYQDILAAQLRAGVEAQTVRAQSLSATSAPPPVAPVDAGVLSEPEAEYTRHVMTAIKDAMLENSSALRLASDDKLTVAARDDAPVNPLNPTDQADVRTMYFTITGADLAAYREGRITLEEARKLIVVTEH
jgi:hypothetical protein